MTDDPTPILSYEGIPIIVGNMWAKLAETIAEGIPDAFIDKGPEAAIALARCAEACYWQSMGDSDSIEVKDIVAKPSAPEPTE